MSAEQTSFGIELKHEKCNPKRNVYTFRFASKNMDFYFQNKFLSNVFGFFLLPFFLSLPISYVMCAKILVCIQHVQMLNFDSKRIFYSRNCIRRSEILQSFFLLSLKYISCHMPKMSALKTLSLLTVKIQSYRKIFLSLSRDEQCI